MGRARHRPARQCRQAWAWYEGRGEDWTGNAGTEGLGNNGPGQAQTGKVFILKGETEMAAKKTAEAFVIKPPKFEILEFPIIGTAPLVIHRFSAKTKRQMKEKMETGKAASSKKNREAKLTEDLFAEARYCSPEGWDGFNASSVRNALISACRLVGFKMTLAKLSVFVLPNGWDAQEPQIPLVRIYGTATKQEDIARVETGQPYITVRAAYHDWTARIKIRWDADQFTRDDIANLLMRVGMQVGIGEGRPDSKNSTGMGWGLFELQSDGSNT